MLDASATVFSSTAQHAGKSAVQSLTRADIGARHPRGRTGHGGEQRELQPRWETME